MRATKKEDISYLVDEKYMDFFTSPLSECKESEIVYYDFSKYPDIYPDIMIEFKQKVVSAFLAVDDYYSPNGRADKPTWAIMRDKYFGGEPYVDADRMIEHLYEFDNKEMIAFLNYCVAYKERFITGIYGLFAEKGYIGRLLLRLKELPLTIEC